MVSLGYTIWVPNISLERTRLSWSFAGLEEPSEESVSEWVTGWPAAPLNSALLDGMET